MKGHAIPPLYTGILLEDEMDYITMSSSYLRIKTIEKIGETTSAVRILLNGEYIVMVTLNDYENILHKIQE